jgi:hypothetical protein
VNVVLAPFQIVAEDISLLPEPPALASSSEPEEQEKSITLNKIVNIFFIIVNKLIKSKVLKIFNYDI